MKYARANEFMVKSYLRQRELEIYGACTDSQVREVGARQYCQGALEPVIDFWDMDDKTCLEVQFEATDGCAQVIGKVFSKVQALILATTEALFASVFRSLSRDLYLTFK